MTIRFVNTLFIFIFSFFISAYYFYSVKYDLFFQEIDKENSFVLERLPSVKEISFYGIELPSTNNSVPLTNFNILIKQVSDFEAADFLILNLSQVKHIFDLDPNFMNTFKFLTGFERKDHFIFFKQKNNITSPYEEYALFNLLLNKSNFHSVSTFKINLEKNNYMSYLSSEGIIFSENNILSVNSFYSNNSIFAKYKSILEKDSDFFIGFHFLLCILFFILLYVAFMNNTTDGEKDDEVLGFSILFSVILFIIIVIINPFSVLM